MPLSPRVTLILAALVGAGCSAPVVDDAADASGSMTEGLVLVERAVSGDGATQTNVSAKFMRLNAGADVDLAEHIIGSRLDLPTVGQCMTMPAVDVAEKSASLASLGPIDLVDVGDLTVRIRPSAEPLKDQPSAMPLAARAFPDVGDFVSGVFYTSRDAQSDLPAGAIYALEGTGSPQVDRFSVEAEAPTAPDDVRLGDAPLRDGITLTDGSPVQVQWASSPPSINDHHRADVVVIDVRSAGGAAVRCAFKDEGKAVLPGSALHARTPGGTASITFHRIRRRSFEIGRSAASPSSPSSPSSLGTGGVDVGEVRFDLSVIGRATIAPRVP